MAVLSILRGRGQVLARLPLLVNKNGAQMTAAGNALQLVRPMSGHQMVITASRWQWHKFKDYLHFYVMLGVIPLTLLSLYVNIFVGSAKLAMEPEDRVPDYWEYYSHPITRFIARNFGRSYQQEYEMMLHAVYEEDYRMKLRVLEKKVKAKMAERGDYQAYYYQPVTGHYTRYVRSKLEESKRLHGE